MSTPEAIEPETKSWTWVLDEVCPECGFNATTFEVSTTGDTVRGIADRWQVVLAHRGSRVRPAARVWSPLEYGCHVRDVLAVFDQRLERMLREDDPLFENWDQDRTAVQERYDLQEPHEVAGALSARAAAIADRFDSVHGVQWQRRCRIHRRLLRPILRARSDPPPLGCRLPRGLSGNKALGRLVPGKLAHAYDVASLHASRQR
jgi:hypothetical protein